MAKNVSYNLSNFSPPAGPLEKRAHWPLRFGLASMFSMDSADHLPEILAALHSGTAPENATTWLALAQLVTAGLIIIGGWQGWRGNLGTFITRFGAAIGLPAFITAIPGENLTQMAEASGDPSALATQPGFLIFCLLAYFLMARPNAERTA